MRVTVDIITDAISRMNDGSKAMTIADNAKHTSTDTNIQGTITFVKNFTMGNPHFMWA